MTLQQLLYFKEVAMQRHFTRAADSLFVAQSSLSHSIRALEDELGVPLFNRKGGKKVELTNYGEEFLMHATEILAKVDETARIMAAMRNPKGGIVNIVYSYLNGYMIIPPALTAFYEEYGREDITLRYNVNHGVRMIEEELKNGVYDLAFSCARHYSGLVSEPIIQQDLFLYVPINHPLADRESVTIRELENEPILVHNQGRHLHRWMLEMFEKNNVMPNIIEYFPDWSAQLTAIAMGDGVSIMPPLPYDNRLIKTVKIDDPMSKRWVYLHYAEGKELSPAAKRVKAFFEEYFYVQQNK